VTESTLWMEGEHSGHMAGEDLTLAMEIAPHGEEIMEKMRVVGTIIS
jgi:predicted heme/steroid binding protein